ncbi:MAG: MBL fold metallo-hydrolase [Termitinemataceae bacterium]|nr:MAG: MBL fold metallo-hydrolase [Termitinemataceae bacterium]
MFSLRFWGVRGSVPSPGFDTNIFGGNTTSLEIRTDDKIVFVDCGTGIKEASKNLIKNDFNDGLPELNVFISHSHWDHILGFPMFTPLFIPGAKIHFRGPNFPNGESLRSVFSYMTSYKYWPIRLSELPANMTFEQINEQTIDLGNGLKVTSKYLNHPVRCLGYRFEYKNKVIVTAFDTEPFWNPFALFKEHSQEAGDSEYCNLICDDYAFEAGEKATEAENKKMFDFIKDADILIYDSSYTEDEYENSKLNWGHTSYETAINSALTANVKKLILFHHDPLRTDKKLSEIEKRYCSSCKNKQSMEIALAREGLILEL